MNSSVVKNLLFCLVWVFFGAMLIDSPSITRGGVNFPVLPWVGWIFCALGGVFFVLNLGSAWRAWKQKDQNKT
ncbi:MAG: hypothetical protein AB7E32_11160 [Desulfovibrio sp.]